MQPIVDIALLSIGFLLPWIATVAIYASLHQLPAFVEWCFTRNLQYAGKGVSGSPLQRGVQSTLLCVGATIVPWTLSARASWRIFRSSSGPGSKPYDGFALAAVLLLWMTWLAVSTGGRFYEHYYLQFAPALAVVAAPEAALLIRRFQELSKGLRWALVLGCALPAFGVTGYSWARGIAGQYPSQEARSREVADFLRANSGPEEKLFIWGHYSPIYLLAQRWPGTRYLNTSVHMGNFDPNHLPESFDPAPFRSERDIAATLEDLATRKPELIVDTAPADIHQWHKVPLARFPELQSYIDTHYRIIGRPANAVVYRRIGTPAAVETR